MNWTLLSTENISEIYYRLFFDHCFFCSIKSTTLICNNCLNGIDENLTYCLQCKLPTNVPLYNCGTCQKNQPKYHTLIAPYLYQGLIKALISQLKFSQANSNTYALCTLLAKQLHQHYSDNSNTLNEIASQWPDTIVYVPSHINRIRERGFCHMTMLAKTLVSQLPKHIKIDHYLLKKATHNKAQHNQDKQQRLKIKSNTFRTEAPIPEHIALLDDVITTGATIEACVKALQKAGAKRIDVWAFARTPLPNFK